MFQVDGGPCFLEDSDVIALHRDQVDATGEPSEILNIDGLISAIMAVQTAHWFGVKDVFLLAAKYAFGISKAHAFLQGNKRTGLAACLAFLAYQGQDVSGYSNAVLVASMYGLVENYISPEEFAEYLKQPSVLNSARILGKRLRHELGQLVQKSR